MEILWYYFFYVDAMLTVGQDKISIEVLKLYLSKFFSMKDIDPMKQPWYDYLRKKYDYLRKKLYRKSAWQV